MSYSLSKELNIVKKNGSKQKVIDAASKLFFQKGFHGTSVRDIAHEATVNVSSISYYFKSKQGLLEFAVTNYYEEFIQTMRNCLNETTKMHSMEQLKQLILSIIQYKQNNYQFSCFIHRELSFDSIFVREMAVTYIAKENYYLSEAFYKALPPNSQHHLERKYLFMQLKGMLVTPYLLHNEWKRQLLDDYSEKLFIEKYVNTIYQWLDFIIEKQTLLPQS